MSRRRKNNHYHYAEKFEPRVQARRARRMLHAPRKAVFFAVIVLFIFGIISTTFASQVTEYYSTADNGSTGLRVTLRSIKASREVADTGANVDLAQTSYGVDGGMIYFDASGLTVNHLQVALLGQKKDTNHHGHYIELTNITGTKLYKATVNNGGITNLWHIRMFDADAAWGDSTNTTVSAMETNIQNNSNWYSNSYGIDLWNTHNYYITKASTSNNAGLTISETNPFTADQVVSVLPASSGNKVKQTCYHWNSGSPTTTANDNVTTSATYSGAVKTGTCKLEATATTGYRFDGYYSSNSTFNNTTILSTNSTYTYTVTAATTVYARFVPTYAITVAKSPSSYTYDPYNKDTLDYTVSGGNRIYTIDQGSSAHLDAALQTGVSVSWSTGDTTAAITVTPTADTTYTATYTLANPTISAFSYSTATYLMEAYTGTPSVTAAAASQDSSKLSYAYSMAPKENVSSADSSTYSINPSTGVARATIPGVYVVTVTVTESVYGLTSTATSTTEITFTPNAPDFSRTATGYAEGDGESSATPFEVPLNEASFVYTTAVSSPIEGYTYTWQTSIDGTNWTSAGTGTGTTITPVTTSSTSVIHLYIRVQAEYNGAAILSTSDDTYYQIVADFLRLDEFNFSTRRTAVQKIYSVDNYETLFASYTASSDNYTTNIYYSPYNKSFTSVLTVSDTDTTPRSVFYNLVADSVNCFTQMRTTGPKWFYLNTVNSDNTRSVNSDTIHTTVGTNSTAGSYPIYFKSANTFANKRVMAGFIVDGSPVYQTGQPVSDGNGGVRYYRFNVPAGATEVMFFISSGNYYMLPTYSGEVFSMSDTDVFLAYTVQYDLNSSAPLFTAASFTDNEGVIDLFAGSFGPMS